MDGLLAYNVVVDECFKFSITMLLNSTIMLVIVLHYASICFYASILLLCSKLCQHNSPRPISGATTTDRLCFLQRDWLLSNSSWKSNQLNEAREIGRRSPDPFSLVRGRGLGTRLGQNSLVNCLFNFCAVQFKNW